MNGLENQKPSYDEWMYWTQVIVDRLTTVTRVYGNPPHADVFMPERERQTKLNDTVRILHHLHQLTDENELSLPKDPAEAAAHEETMVAALQPLYREILGVMPVWSGDMQKLLKSPWFDECAGKLAHTLFRGPNGNLNEGIGSGMPENGRLPAVIEQLMEREAVGESRAPRIEKPRHAQPRMRREELARLWSKKKSSLLGSAGRIE